MTDIFESIRVYDDLVPEHIQDFLFKFFMQNDGGCWHFASNLTGTQDVTENSNSHNPGLCAPISSGEKSRFPDADFFTRSLLGFLKKENAIGEYELIGSRAFLQLPNGQDSVMAEPHTDWNSDVEHTVVIYYVNDSNGETCLIDKTNKEVELKNILNVDYKVIKKVSPKKGRLVVFDGSIYHASSSPTLMPRCVINFNLKNINIE